jgi:hypothetical protein
MFYELRWFTTGKRGKLTVKSEVWEGNVQKVAWMTHCDEFDFWCDKQIPFFALSA